MNFADDNLFCNVLFAYPGGITTRCNRPRKMPNTGIRSSPWTYRVIVDADWELIHKMVEKTLNKIDGITFMYHDCCWKWHIRYGTLPFYNTLDPLQQQVYHRKSRVLHELVDSLRYTEYMKVSPLHFIKLGITLKHMYAFCDVIRAAVPYDNDDYFEETEPIKLEQLRGWSDNMIQYSQCEGGGIAVDLHRYCGSSGSNLYIRKQIIAALQPNNILFERRKSYLELCEIVGEAVENEYSYLFHHYVCREICTYL